MYERQRCNTCMHYYACTIMHVLQYNSSCIKHVCMQLSATPCTLKTQLPNNNDKVIIITICK